MPETLSAKAVSLSLVLAVSTFSCRTRPAMVKWPQSALCSQRAVRSGTELSSLEPRAPLR